MYSILFNFKKPKYAFLIIWCLIAKLRFMFQIKVYIKVVFVLKFLFKMHSVSTQSNFIHSPDQICSNCICHYLNPAWAAISKMVQNFYVAQKLAKLQPFACFVTTFFKNFSDGKVSMKAHFFNKICQLILSGMLLFNVAIISIQAKLLL